MNKELQIKFTVEYWEAALRLELGKPIYLHKRAVFVEPNPIITEIFDGKS